MKNFSFGVAAVVIAAAAYLTLWPVAVEPIAWNAPSDAGYTGDFTPNQRLAGMELVDLGRYYGPEDADIGPDRLIYAATHGGEILRVQQDGSVSVFAETGGRPLGIEFDATGTLWVADAYRGLLSVSADGTVRLRSDQTSDGSPILYADDVDIAPDGAVYFSDASTRFSAQAMDDTLEASVFDLMEHSDNGRVLRYDPNSGETTVFASGLTFANGIAIIGDSIFVAETGAYRIWRYPLAGGAGEVIIDNLPGFPDNLNPGPNGTLWFGLASPRNLLIDNLSDSPFLRKVIMRLPSSMRPAPVRYGFVGRVDTEGEVIETLQDPSGKFALTTGAISLPDGRVLITSLTEPSLGILE
ncbi:MAG: SMP-30/gluconolactonase/LRE family protein [Pseudomonadota bacterium]